MGRKGGTFFGKDQRKKQTKSKVGDVSLLRYHLKAHCVGLTDIAHLRYHPNRPSLFYGGSGQIASRNQSAQ
jgi:hypothetical protein